MRIQFWLSGFLFLFICQVSYSQVYAPSAQELRFQYQASFVTSVDSDPTEKASLHASHLFGLFHSPTLINKFGLDPDLVGGVGAPRADQKIKILSVEKIAGDKNLVVYKNEGVALFHKAVAKKILASKNLSLNLPLPYDLDRFYDIRCTDEHYTSEGDFWYFFDSFRQGCEHLKKEPLAKSVEVVFSEMQMPRMVEQTPRLDLLRGDNQNGNLFEVSIFQGFADGANAKNDEGRANYQGLVEWLRSEGYAENVVSRNPAAAERVFSKTITLASGKKIEVRVYAILATTSINSRSLIFAQKLKRALEKSDVVIYGGHSGLGGNLDIESLEAKAGAIKLNPKKRQLLFFDSCSSYSYYLTMFGKTKSRSKIDVITNGLSSYFHTANPIRLKLLGILTNPEIQDSSWENILNTMESDLDGGSYLLNVGGI